MSSRPPTKAECFAAFYSASQCLDQEGIRHWIDFGTLLGAVREGGYIACDQDVDFNFHREDLPRLLALRDTLDRCYNLELFFDPAVNTVRLLPRHPLLDLTSDTSAHRSCVDAGVPYADLYPCRTDGKWLRHPVAEYDFRSIFSRRLERILFEGWSLPCPQNFLSLLFHRYGANWHLPLGRSEFDTQAQRLIEPFPDPLGCVLVVADQTPPDHLVEEIHQLRLDFDVIVALVPASPFDAAQLRDALRQFPEVQIRLNSQELVTPGLLASFGCHYVKLIGAVPGSTMPVHSDLDDADVVLRN